MDVPGVAEAVAGQNPGSVLFHKRDGFFYHVREIRGRRARMQCRHYSKGCRSTATVNLVTGLLRRLKPHNHAPDRLLLDDEALRREMMEDARANNFAKTARQILNEHRLRCANAELAARFTSSRMASQLNRARGEAYPGVPNSLLHLGILLATPDLHPVCRTIDNADTIFKAVVGNLADRSVCIVLISGRMLDVLRRRKSVHGDGTFKKRCRKPKSAQIYSFTCLYDGVVLCLMRVLMMSMTVEAYLALFNYVRQIAPTFHPERIHCDFEKAQMRAFRMVFPNAAIVGCLWHFGVAFSGQARKLGLAGLAAEEEEVFSFIRCLCAAPLLPAAIMWQGVLQIWVEVVEANWEEELKPLFQYFRREWLPRMRELSVWGHPERTNNCSESDHHMMASILPQNHPNVWQMMRGFVKMEFLAWSDKLAVDASRPVNGSRNWKSVWNDDVIQRLSRRLGNGDITPAEFLHGASWTQMAAVNHGLRFRDGNGGNAESDTDSSSSGSDSSSSESDSSSSESDSSDSEESEESGEEESASSDDG